MTGQETCTGCAAGKFQKDAGATMCESCGGGRYCTASGVGHEPDGAGRYRNDTHCSMFGSNRNVGS